MVAPQDTNRILNQILGLEQYSLATYLLEIHPWMRHDDKPLWETVRHMAADQQHYAERIGRLIVDRDGVVGGGNYPMRFTSLNDLALDYLAKKLIDHQRLLIRQLTECVAQLEGDRPAWELATEVLGAEKGHLETLTELWDRQHKPVSQS